MNEQLLKIRANQKMMVPESTQPNLYTILQKMALSIEPQVKVNSDSTNIKITFAEPGKRIRKVVRRSNYRMTGKFPSRKKGDMAHWESEHELNAFRILEICPFVKSYNEQPAILRFADNNAVTHLHYPDILVELNSGQLIFVEVKSESAVTDLKLTNRTNLLKNELATIGYQYLMVFPEQLASFEYLENAKHLLQYSKVPMPTTAFEAVRRIFSGLNTIQLSSLVMYLEHPSARSWIYKMLLTGDLACDLSKLLSSKSIITWSNRGDI